MIEETSENRPDEELVSEFQDGNESAFDALVLRHQDRVLNLCYQFIGNYEEAKDAAQEVFIKAYGALRKFRKEAAFKSWIYRITMNQCKNKVVSKEFRNRKKNLRLETDDGEERITIQRTSPYSQPVEALARKEKEEIVQNALHALESLARQLIILKDIEGLSYEEITTLTGLKLGTLKSKLARARNQLTQKLRKMYELQESTKSYI